MSTPHSPIPHGSPSDGSNQDPARPLVAGRVNPETLHQVTCWLDSRLAGDDEYRSASDAVRLASPWQRVGYRYVGHNRVLFLYRPRTRTYVLLPTATVEAGRHRDADAIRRVWADAVEGSFSQILAWVCAAWPRFHGFVGQPLLAHQSTVLDPAAFGTSPAVMAVATEMLLASGRAYVEDSHDIGETVSALLHVQRHSVAAGQIIGHAAQRMERWVAQAPEESFFPEHIEETCWAYEQALTSWLVKHYATLVRDPDDPVDNLREDLAL